jgi:hypothetical protein
MPQRINLTMATLHKLAQNLGMSVSELLERFHSCCSPTPVEELPFRAVSGA